MHSKSSFSSLRAGGATMVSVVALSLLLAGCNSPEPTAPVESNMPSATASETASTSKKIKAGEFFNNDAQRVLDVQKTENVIYLPTGIVSSASESGQTTKISFVPFEESSKSWEYEVPESDGNNETTVGFIRWEGKTYVVADILVTGSTEGSGLEKDVSKNINKTYVIDAVTGKMVNVVEASFPGSDSTSVYTHDVGVPGPNDPKSVYTEGLVFLKLDSGERIVNPLTGETVSEKPVATVSDYNSDTYPMPVARFGDHVVVTNQTNSDKKVMIFNPVTDQKVETECRLSLGTERDFRTSFSDDFRYFNLAGALTFDTKTNTAFCTDETDTRAAVNGLGISNTGIIYGVAEKGETSFVEVPFGKIDEAKVTPADEDLPGLITPEGAGIFNAVPGEYVIVPKK